MFPQIFGKYVLEGEIAVGGMARVYLATLRGAGGFEKRLVVKQIRAELGSDPAFVARFVAEAKTAVSLSHPNIVPVYELGAEQGTYYIAMEHCEGRTLAELLRGGPLSPEEGAYLGVEICRALDYAHRRAGVVHRDVTPRNVMIDAEGAVRLIDFGIVAPAESAAGDGPASDLPARGTFGSPGHMPVEQYHSGPLTAATDVFAVATVMYEAWTGIAPFRRSTAEQSRAALQQPPAPLGELQPALGSLSSVVATALAVEPTNRPGTAEQLARPLREFLRAHDLGDCARKLGARVVAMDAPAVVSDRRESARTADTPRLVTTGAHTPPGSTQTFAQKEELVEWTRRLSSAPPPADPAGASGSSGGSEHSKREVTGRRGALRALAGMGLVGLVGAVVLARSPSDRQSRATASPAAANGAVNPTGAIGAGPSPTHQPTSDSALPSVRPGPAAPERPPSPPAPPSTRGRVAASEPAARGSSAAAGEVARAATLVLTADPAARASVDGRSYATPARGVSLAPGAYAVRFDNALLGESVSVRVTLGPGEQRAVHADFTGSTPRALVR